MGAVAEQVKSAKQPFGLQRATIDKLGRLAKRFLISPSLLVERYIALAHGELFEGDPCVNVAFVPRLRELAARREHPGMELRTSFALDSAHVVAIRRLRDGLQLPRRDLVVEYVVQAAWDTRAPDDDPDGGDSEDPLKRSRRASRHNVENSATSSRSATVLPFVLPTLREPPDRPTAQFLLEEFSKRRN